jgi:small subunit ribosomal protein S3
MGQKVNPIGFRLGVIKGWDSSWYGGKTFALKLVEDEKIRKYIFARIPKGGISKIIIERTLKRITLIINTARPGVVIGKRDLSPNVGVASSADSSAPKKRTDGPNKKKRR